MDNIQEHIQGLKFFDKQGKEVPVDEHGHIGLLAIGYRGTLAWREARAKAIAKVITNKGNDGSTKA